MYINSVYIEKYKVLEDLRIEFVVPKNNKNVVNVIAGVNGCGKSTILELISKTFNFDFTKNFYDDIKFNIKCLDKYNLIQGSTKIEFNDEYGRVLNGEVPTPTIIFLPMSDNFNYEIKEKFDLKKEFSMQIKSDSLLGNAELYIKNYIIGQERQSREPEPHKRTLEAVENFNRYFGKCEFVTKLVDLDQFDMNRPIFETINGEKVTIEKLSSGEQQLYARVVSLMILNPHNSIILIDEPEIALHPKWQIEIMKIYSSIGENNQFIVTTHSPHIIADTHLNNLILLVKEDNKIVAKQPKSSPLGFERDLNSITKMLMGADYTPSWLDKIKKEYRELVENGEMESEKAKTLREQILEYEDENSEYMQGINFYVDLHS